jgi:hypothetical protein
MRWCVAGCCLWVVACGQGQQQKPASRDWEAEHPPPPPPELVRTPDRPRFVHEPPAYPNFRFRASRVGLQLIDTRSEVRPAQPAVPALALPADGAVLHVGLPPGFEQLAQERLARVTGGSGPELSLSIEVRKLTAAHRGELRQVTVEFDFTMRDARGRALLRGRGRGSKDLLGPPYDNTELEDIHRAACSDALDSFLTKETNIALVNEVVASH